MILSALIRFSLKLLFIALYSIVPTYAHGDAVEWREEKSVCEALQYFAGSATFVLYDRQNNQLVGCNKARAEKRFVPASTFKIANTIIGLETAAVSSVDEILPYGGNPQFLKSWEEDMPLRKAITVSNVPIYQALARRIGLERMANMLKLLHYGNQTIGTTIDRFWLDGPLEISAVEQSIFLARLADSELPISQPIQQQVREILLLEKKDTRSLFGKTGWQNAPGAGVGWWVGWIETPFRTYAFALNVDMSENIQPADRVLVGKNCLKHLDLWQ